MKTVVLSIFISFSYSVYSQVPPVSQQIAAAVQAGPADLHAGAMVYGYDGNGNLIVLRKGTNELICLADNPKKKGFEVDCYHKDLEPFMARSRELRAEGKNNAEIFKIKEDEVKSGKLKMPAAGAALHVLSGADARYNPETGKVENAHYRYVVYMPFATQESTGLPLKPVTNGGPWLMNPGTHRAHIMISTPRN